MLKMNIKKNLLEAPIPPKNATLYITDKCNSRCLSCGVWKKRPGPEAETNEWLAVLKDLKEAGISYLGFSGGEPLLRPDVTELIGKARELGFRFIDLCTNGVLLTRETLHRLAEAGLDRLILSIDGIGETHDRLRGVPGNFSQIEKALNAIRQTSLTAIVQTNLVRLNLDEIPRIIDLVSRYGQAWGMNIINDTQYAFKEIDKHAIADFDLNEIEQILVILKKAINENGPRLLLKKEYLPIIKEILVARNLPFSIPCVSGFQTLYINSSMDLFSGCTAMPPIENLRRSSVGEIIRGVSFHQRIEAMYRRECPGCTCGIWQNVDHHLTQSLR
jgi:MoaA/NifB/PqqE/SkfB family radical SAM enzyme